jgi:diadenosine tetraphosphate (Ap4A) HIT family hydrolase
MKRKIDARQDIRHTHTCRIRRLAICDPMEFWSSGMQEYIQHTRSRPDHGWIFDLVDGLENDPLEEILIYNEDWILCRDRHPSRQIGSAMRYLVIFKDTTLHTIRDLTRLHIPMLMQVQKQCRQFLLALPDTGSWRMYFNYMPSVFQLHLHISSHEAHTNNREQPLGCVIRNLHTNPFYYANALIATKYYGKKIDTLKHRPCYTR